MKNGFKSFITKQYRLLVVTSVVISGLALALQYKPAVKLIPIKAEKREGLYQVSTFDDAADNGTSTVSAPSVAEEYIRYTCTIRGGTEYPYSGLSLFARPELNKKINDYLHFEDYSHISIKANIDGHSSVLFSIKTFVKGLTQPNSPLTRKPNEVTLTGVNSVINKKIALSELETPAWWFTSNKTNKEKVGTSDYSKVMELVFQNGEDSPRDQEITISVSEIALTKDISSEAGIILALLALFLGAFSAVRFAKVPEAEEKGSKIVISYDRVEIEDEHDNEVQRIVDYIRSNYPNPELSVEQLAKGAGVSTSRIPTILKNKYSMNFKQYLNTIRIAEAKRLLLETEHQIVTIAHSVGYNNIPHFNRTFKQVTGLSPKMYRESPEQAIDNMPGSTGTKL